MKKTIFLGNSTKFFLRNGVYGVTIKKFCRKLLKRWFFSIFGVKLDFNDL